MKKSGNEIILIIRFLFNPTTIIFYHDKPIYIAKKEEETLAIIKNIDPKQKRKIYLANYISAIFLFKAKWWLKLKRRLTAAEKKSECNISTPAKNKLEELKKIEAFLLNYEKGIWN